MWSNLFKAALIGLFVQLPHTHPAVSEEIEQINYQMRFQSQPLKQYANEILIKLKNSSLLTTANKKINYTNYYFASLDNSIIKGRINEKVIKFSSEEVNSILSNAKLKTNKCAIRNIFNRIGKEIVISINNPKTSSILEQKKCFLHSIYFFFKIEEKFNNISSIEKIEQILFSFKVQKNGQ